LWQQFREGPFLFQHDNAPLHKAWSIQKLFVRVEELDWFAQSPYLNPIKHLWDELERRLRAWPYRPTSVSGLTEWNGKEWLNGSKSQQCNVPTSNIKPSQKWGGFYSSKEGTNSILMPMNL
jgi:hypothetical protein